MANNPYVNKVQYGNNTVIDISDADVQESDVASGKIFYKGNGQRSTGTSAGAERKGICFITNNISSSESPTVIFYLNDIPVYIQRTGTNVTLTVTVEGVQSSITIQSNLPANTELTVLEWHHIDASHVIIVYSYPNNYGWAIRYARMISLKFDYTLYQSTAANLVAADTNTNEYNYLFFKSLYNDADFATIAVTRSKSTDAIQIIYYLTTINLATGAFTRSSTATASLATSNVNSYINTGQDFVSGGVLFNNNTGVLKLCMIHGNTPSYKQIDPPTGYTNDYALLGKLTDGCPIFCGTARGALYLTYYDPIDGGIKTIKTLNFGSNYFKFLAFVDDTFIIRITRDNITILGKQYNTNDICRVKIVKTTDGDYSLKLLPDFVEVHRSSEDALYKNTKYMGQGSDLFHEIYIYDIA